MGMGRGELAAPGEGAGFCYQVGGHGKGNDVSSKCLIICVHLACANTDRP